MSEKFFTNEVRDDVDNARFDGILQITPNERTYFSARLSLKAILHLFTANSGGFANNDDDGDGDGDFAKFCCEHSVLVPSKRNTLMAPMTWHSSLCVGCVSRSERVRSSVSIVD